MPYAIRLFPIQRPCPYYVPSESVTLRGFGHAILYQSMPGVEILPISCALSIASSKGIAHAMCARLSLVKKLCLCLSQFMPSLKLCVLKAFSKAMPPLFPNYAFFKAMHISGA